MKTNSTCKIKNMIRALKIYSFRFQTYAKSPLNDVSTWYHYFVIYNLRCSTKIQKPLYKQNLIQTMESVFLKVYLPIFFNQWRRFVILCQLSNKMLCDELYLIPRTAKRSTLNFPFYNCVQIVLANRRWWSCFSIAANSACLSDE